MDTPEFFLALVPNFLLILGHMLNLSKLLKNPKLLILIPIILHGTSKCSNGLKRFELSTCVMRFCVLAFISKGNQ